MLAQKRRVRVTLDIECYDDLDLKSFDWNDILGLEGDEDILDINICLLYTSPSPRDQRGSRMPSSA